MSRSLLQEWPGLSQLLDDALTIAPESRFSWLDSLEGLNAAQRDTLHRLLAVSADPHELLGELPRFQMAVGDTIDPLDPLVADQLIGPYRLLSCLGEGGMGSVWLAERHDRQPVRKVAIKLPHVGWEPGLRARLARERDILASLEHPNIARLYDAGIDGLGRPYLAMEYVDGLPITDYCTNHSIDLRHRLELVCAVAAAVAYAHTRLVVHRDLKPSNIFVTHAGEVRLLDFGIAKFLQADPAEEDLTKLAERAVTPGYSSPEQMRGEAIGTPSDVYSLGVVTYELLSGTRPYRLSDAPAAGLAEALMHAPLQPLSRAAHDPKLRRQLRGDLDAILNRALKKDPAERYQTVAEFSADMSRHMNDLPIHARPDGWRYRMRKFLLRNALPVGAAVLVGIAVFTGSSISLWKAYQARIEAARADQVKQFVLSIFADADTDSGSDAGTTAADLLSAAQARVETELSTRPAVAVELMTAIAYGLLGQGRVAQAATVSAKAVALADARLGKDHRRSMEARIVYGEALQDSGESARALAVLTPSIEEARRLNARVDLAQGLQWRSAALMDLQRPDEAVDDAREALAALPAPVTRADKVLGSNINSLLANTLVNADQAGASSSARHALELAQQAFGGRVSEASAASLNALALALKHEGDYVGAADAASTAIDQYERLFRPNYPLIRYTLQTLGEAKWHLGDIDAAIAAEARALKIDEQRAGDQFFSLANCHQWLGLYLLTAHRYAEALQRFDSAREKYAAAGDGFGELLARAQSLKALCLARLGRLEEAEILFDELAPQFKPGDAAYAIFHSFEAELRSLQGWHEQALRLAQASVETRSSAKRPLFQASANLTLGRALIAAGRPAQAAEPLRTALDLYRTEQVVESPDQKEAADLLAATQASSGTAPHGGATSQRP